MPRINPRSLINCLECLLNEQGGIRGASEVQRMIGLMGKFSNTLVSKVCYTLILCKTEASLLTEFLSSGGWKLVFQWLGDAIVNGNNPFIKEILQLLIICPIRIDFLRESNAPRIVKGLSKDSEDPVVRDLAKRVVEMWLDYIKTNQAELCHVSEPLETPEPEPEPAQEVPAEKKPQLIPPFKLILRGGKRFLVTIDPENVPHKLKRIKTEKDSDAYMPNGEEPAPDRVIKIKTENDSDSYIPKVEEPVHDRVIRIKTEIKTENDSDSYIPKVEHSIKVRDVDNKSNIIRFKPKTLIKSESQVKNRDADKDRSEKKVYQRSSSQKAIKTSHSKLKESESRKDKQKDYSRLKSKPVKEEKHEVRSKSKENTKKLETSEDALIRPTPAISSLGKIPKKTAPTATMSAAEATATGGVLGGGAKEPNPLPVVKKGTFSDERKRTAELKPSDRPKTVKTLPTKFRSTGLEEEIKPPTSRKKESVKDVVKRPAPPSPKEVSALPEKKLKLPESKEKVEKPGIKLIPAKPKLVLVESDMFSDALTASSAKEHRKKKSRRSSSGSTKDDGKKEGDESSSKHRKSKSPPKATSPSTEVKPLKFYRDTLEEPENQSKKAESEEEEDDEAAGPPKVKLYPDGILVVSRSRRAPKKSIRWRGETDLVSIKYFDLDENERVNVSRTNFMDLKAMERNRERENLMLHKHGSESDKDEKPWGPLYLIDIPHDKRAPERVVKSLEKEIQLARQRTVLEAIFFHKSNVPDSPAEPDPENHPMTDPKPMPLEDGSGKEFDHSNTPWPDGKTDKLDGILPAVVASAIPTFSATGFSYPGFPGAPGPESWLPGESGKEGSTAAAAVAAVAAAFPQNGLSIPPPFRAPFGPPPNGMIGPEGYMFPPSGFPMPFGPVPPMGMMAGWGRGGGFNGPRPPLPLEAQNICRSWSRSGKCYRGNLCRFLHPGSNCPPLS